MHQKPTIVLVPQQQNVDYSKQMGQLHTRISYQLLACYPRGSQYMFSNRLKAAELCTIISSHSPT